jgi:hypothetical protein
MHIFLRRRLKYTLSFIFALVGLGFLRYHQVWFTDQLLLGSVAASITIYLGMLRYQVDQDQVFRQLFKEFNERYDAMDNDLAKLGNMEPSEARLKVISYLNLCAEEYLWYKKGRIDEAVWQAWFAGIKEKLRHPIILEVVTKENESIADSYYGLMSILAPLLTRGPKT